MACAVADGAHWHGLIMDHMTDLTKVKPSTRTNPGVCPGVGLTLWKCVGLGETLPTRIRAHRGGTVLGQISDRLPSLRMGISCSKSGPECEPVMGDGDGMGKPVPNGPLGAGLGPSPSFMIFLKFLGRQQDRCIPCSRIFTVNLAPNTASGQYWPAQKKPRRYLARAQGAQLCGIHSLKN